MEETLKLDPSVCKTETPIWNWLPNEYMAAFPFTDVYRRRKASEKRMAEHMEDHDEEQYMYNSPCKMMAVDQTASAHVLQNGYVIADEEDWEEDDVVVQDEPMDDGIVIDEPDSWTPEPHTNYGAKGPVKQAKRRLSSKKESPDSIKPNIPVAECSEESGQGSMDIIDMASGYDWIPNKRFNANMTYDFSTPSCFYE